MILLLCSALLFSLCSQSTGTPVNCSSCPALPNTDCKCSSLGLYCYWSSAADNGQFPSFNNASTCQPLSLYIENYQFSIVPANAFAAYKFPIARLTFYKDPIQFVDRNAFSSPNVQNYLNYLYFSRANLTSIPSQALQSLNTLNTLTMRYNSGLQHLPPDGFPSNLATLTTLRIVYNPSLSSLAPFAFRGLTNLTSLSLYGNSFALLPQNAFAGLKNLNYLSIYNNPIVVIQAGAFVNLPITYFSVSFDPGATVQKGAFQSISQLTSMNLYMNNLGLGNQTCFSSVYLSCTEFPALNRLYLLHAACADVLQNFYNQQCIKTLWISYNYYSQNQLSPICLNQIGQMQSVQSLSLSLQQVAYLNASAMTNLQSLYVSGLRSGNLCDESLATMPNLQSLTLTGARDRHYIPPAVKNMTKLTKLFVDSSYSYYISLYCNCSNYWVCSFTQQQNISTSGWKCMSSTYSSFNTYCSKSQGDCGGPQPFVPEINAQTCQNGGPCNHRPMTTMSPWTSTAGPTMLKVFLEFFDNTAGGGLLAQTPLSHCDTFWFGGLDQCDIDFQICVEFMPSNISMSKCSTGWIDLEQISTNKNNATFTTGRYGGWSNPMVYPLPSQAYQGFQLKYIAYDADNGGAQLIDLASCQYSTNSYSKTQGIVGCKHMRKNGYPTYLKFGYKVM